jgi:LysM repeat protein
MSKFTNTMRKSTLIVLMLALAFSVHAQNLYLQYDSQCMDKMEYKFVQAGASNVSYTAYRFNKNNSEKFYFETGIESVVIHKAIPGKLTKCSNITLNKTDISEINRGRKKVYLCKKLDSGWAILPIGTASHMTYNNNTLTFLGPDYDFKADLSQPLGGLNLTESSESNMSSIYYGGTSDACNQAGYLFKKSPNETCKDETTLMIIPKIGLAQDITSSGQNFELASINNMPVCAYLNGKTAPAVTIQSEPKPESIPTEYSKPIVYEKPAIAADVFVEEPAVEAVAVAEGLVAETNANEFVASKGIEVQPKADCNIVAKEGEHVVNQGESLYGIARRYGLTVNNIRSWNTISGDVIQPCTVIKVIAPVIIEQPSMTIARTKDVPMSFNENVAPKPKKIDCNVDAKESEHVIQQGENLSTIARKYNLKIDQLRTWNNLQSDILQPCTKLTIVAPVVTVKAVPTQYATVVKPKVVKTVAKPVVVKKVVIARPKVTPKAVKVAKVEPKPVVKKEAIVYVKKESCMHVAVEGETVSLLAKQFGVSEIEFRKFNNLGANDPIRTGQVLKKSSSPCFVENELPANYCVVPTPQSAVKTKAQVVPKNYSVTVKPKSVNTVTTTTTVKKEDIPKEYNTVALPKPIKVKETVVTAKSVDLKSRKYHVVKSDETIFSISKIYGISVDKLRSLNSLEPTELIIPNQLLVLE